jgi:hypothetical protein
LLGHRRPHALSFAAGHNDCGNHRLILF